MGGRLLLRGHRVETSASSSSPAWRWQRGPLPVHRPDGPCRPMAMEDRPYGFDDLDDASTHDADRWETGPAGRTAPATRPSALTGFASASRRCSIPRTRPRSSSRSTTRAPPRTCPSSSSSTRLACGVASSADDCHSLKTSGVLVPRYSLRLRRSGSHRGAAPPGGLRSRARSELGRLSAQWGIHGRCGRALRTSWGCAAGTSRMLLISLHGSVMLPCRMVGAAGAAAGATGPR